jgi:hypothetical protein
MLVITDTVHSTVSSSPYLFTQGPSRTLEAITPEDRMNLDARCSTYGSLHNYKLFRINFFAICSSLHYLLTQGPDNALLVGNGMAETAGILGTIDHRGALLCKDTVPASIFSLCGHFFFPTYWKPLRTV